MVATSLGVFIIFTIDNMDKKKTQESGVNYEYSFAFK